MKNLILGGIFLAAIGVHTVFTQAKFVTVPGRSYHNFRAAKTISFIQVKSAPFIIEMPSSNTLASKTPYELPLVNKAGDTVSGIPNTENSVVAAAPSNFEKMGFGSIKANDIN